jgi:mannosyltransferase OCH1-like enzyme
MLYLTFYMPIPRILHQIWVGPNPLPEKSHVFIEQIKTLHPDYEYRLWTDADITPANFTNYEYIMKTKNYAQKADIMRYEILYKFGGIYLDIDMEVFKNLSPLLTHDLIVCNEDGNIHRYMTNAFIAASKQNAQLLACVNAIPTIDFTKPVNVATGPYFFRKCIRLTDSVSILPTAYIYPTHYTNPHAKFEHTSTTYMCHHWNKNW